MESSSIGIPQHWQISFLGSPKSVLIETSFWHYADNGIYGTKKQTLHNEYVCLSKNCSVFLNFFQFFLNREETN